MNFFVHLFMFDLFVFLYLYYIYYPNYEIKKIQRSIFFETKFYNIFCKFIAQMLEHQD